MSMLDPTRFWYRKKLHFLSFLLLPFAYLFAFIVSLRSWLYRSGILKSYALSVPVIVCGNITVGGTGKTPFVIWLAKFLQSHGFHPAIVTRGVGGNPQYQAQMITDRTEVADVGDEAILLKQQTNCPVVVGIDRVQAAKLAIENCACDIILTDDGLQHYRLQRDIEIAIVDSKREFGNQQLLPAGPLREAISRLKTVDFVVYNCRHEEVKDVDFLYPMQFKIDHLISLKNPSQTYTINDFPHRHVHAIAGIGHPEQFFAHLQRLGFQVIAHTFKDHYLYQAQDITFDDSFPILMTEKDAVKCKAFAKDECFAVSLSVVIEPKFGQDLLTKLQSCEVRHAIPESKTSIH